MFKVLAGGGGFIVLSRARESTFQNGVFFGGLGPDIVVSSQHFFFPKAPVARETGKKKKPPYRAR